MKNNSKTLLIMIVITIALATSSCVFFYLYFTFKIDWYESLAITFLTTFYHFFMRLLVGEGVTLLFKNKEFPQDKFGFHIFKFEEKLYRLLKVNKWKANVITAKPDQFDIHKVGPKELLHNVMQAELVHRVIMILSYVPLLLIIPFGMPVVFILTSIFASLLDAIFVIIQRYNRPRVIKYIEIIEKRNHKMNNIIFG